MPEPLEAWRRTFRDGVAPQFSVSGLRALRQALEDDDPALIQGDTCTPPPLHECADWPVEAACLVGYASWKGDGVNRVGDLEEEFARICAGINLALDEPAGCRHLLNWFDDMPRDEMRKQLLPEVERALATREEV
jgi:hypothetical protein